MLCWYVQRGGKKVIRDCVCACVCHCVQSTVYANWYANEGNNQPQAGNDSDGAATVYASVVFGPEKLEQKWGTFFRWQQIYNKNSSSSEILPSACWIVRRTHILTLHISCRRQRREDLDDGGTIYSVVSKWTCLTVGRFWDKHAMFCYSNCLAIIFMTWLTLMMVIMSAEAFGAQLKTFSPLVPSADNVSQQHLRTKFSLLPKKKKSLALVHPVKWV